MKLHLPSLLRKALMACLACSVTAFADTYVAEGVQVLGAAPGDNVVDFASSVRFYDGGKGRDWDDYCSAD